MTEGREVQALRADLAALGVVLHAHAGGVQLVTESAAWLHDVLRALGLDGRLLPDRVELPDAVGFARIAKAVQVALRPEALLLDLDGVLADLQCRSAIATPAQLQRLARVLPLGVVTTCPRRLAESVLERHGLRAHIGTVVGVEDAPPKPNPDPLLLAFERLGVTQGWFVGDNPSDVRAAIAAGAVPLAIDPKGIGAPSHAESLRQAGAARLIAGLDEVGALLSRPRG